MKKFLISIVVLLVLVGAVWGVLTQFVIDSDKLSEELVQAMEQSTGRKVTLGDDVQVRLVPVPQVIYTDLKLASIEGAASASLLTSKQLIVKLDLVELFKGHVKTSNVILQNPAFELESLPRGGKSWRFNDGKAHGSAFRNFFLATPITLVDASIKYVNPASGTQLEWQGINGVLSYEGGGASIKFEGDGLLYDKKLSIAANMETVDLGVKDVPAAPFQFVMKYEWFTLNGKGTLAHISDDPEFKGKLDISAVNPWAFVSVFSGNIPQNGKVSSGNISANGQLELGFEKVVLQDLAVNIDSKMNKIPLMKGKIDAAYQLGRQPYLSFVPTLETVDIDALTAAYDAWFAQPDKAIKSPEAEEKPSEETDAALPKMEKKILEAAPWWTVFNHVSGEIEAKIESVFYQGRSVNDFAFSSSLDNGEMTINQMQGQFPGESQLALFGVMKTQKTGIEFDGKLEIQGRTFEQFLTILTPRDVVMPNLNLGVFAMKTNLAFNPTQLRFSELQSRVQDVRAAGAVILKRGDRPKLETFIRLAGADMDVIITALSFFIPESKTQEKPKNDNAKEGIFNVEYINNKFDWLGGLAMDFQTDLLLEDFVLFGRKGEKARMRMEMGVGEAKLIGVNALYNGSKIEGDFSIRTEQGKNPYIDINTHMSELNLVDIFPDLSRSPNDQEWEVLAKKPLEFKELQYYRGKLKGKFDKLNIKQFAFENMDVEAELEPTALKIKRFSGQLWDGQLSATCELSMGTIPSIGVSFQLGNSNLVKFSTMSPFLGNAAGLAGFSGQLTTSGVSLRSWYENIAGAVTLHGQNVVIEGFGLSTLARAVPISHSVADVVNAKRIALDGGQSMFRTLYGQITFQKAVADIPLIQFTSDEAAGTIDGSFDLLKDTVNLILKFTLASTKSDSKPPVLVLEVAGSVDAPKKELNTQELEAYVARSVAERSLQ